MRKPNVCLSLGNPSSPHLPTSLPGHNHQTSTSNHHPSNKTQRYSGRASRSLHSPRPIASAYRVSIDPRGASPQNAKDRLLRVFPRNRRLSNSLKRRVTETHGIPRCACPNNCVCDHLCRQGASSILTQIETRTQIIEWARKAAKRKAFLSLRSVDSKTDLDAMTARVVCLLIVVI